MSGRDFRTSQRGDGGTSARDVSSCSMPRYFFHLEAGSRIEDDVGTELAGADAAKQHALAVLTSMLRSGPTFWQTEEYKVVVANDRGLDLFTLYVGVSFAPAMLHVHPAR